MRQAIELLALWISIIMLMFFSFKEHKYSEKKKKIIISVFLLFYIIIFSIRSMGLDLPNYRRIYESNSLSNLKNTLKIENLFKTQYEFLFLIYMYVAKVLNLQFKGFLMLFYLVPIILIYIIVTKYNKKNMLKAFFLFMAVYFLQFDMIRHIYAITLVILALYNKSFIKSLILSILAVSMHYSAILIIPILLIEKLLSKDTNNYIKFIVFPIIIYVLIVGINKIYDTTILLKLENYLSNTKLKYKSLQLAVFYMMNISPIVWYSLYYLFNRVKIKNNCNLKNRMSIICGIIGALVITLVFKSFYMGPRILFLYSSSLVLVTANNFEKEFITKKDFMIYCCFLIYPILVSLYYVTGVLV